MNKALFTLILIMSVVFTVSAGTYYSKVTVSVASGEGKVYVADNAEVDDSQITENSHSATHSSSPASTSSNYAEHDYWLFAKPDDGFGFEKWNDDNTDNPRKVTVRTESTKKSSPTSFSYEATFAPSLLTISNNDNSLGTLKIDKPINRENDEVKLTAAIVKQAGNSEFGMATHAGHAIRFVGWYNEAGEQLSDDMEFTYTVTKKEKIEGRFEREFTIKTDENGNIYGYYRLQTHYGNDKTNYFLCLTGNFQPNVTTGDRYLMGAVEFNQKPYSFEGTNSSAYAQSDAVFTDAGSVFYVTGEADMQNIKATASRTQVASKLIAEAQGTTTNYLVSGRELVLKTAATPGYYIIFDKTTGASLQLNYSNHIFISTDKPGNATFANNGDLDIQPVDEAHVDINYFGAMPDASMEFDGGYWTSMYTAFPYECYQPDGVEAYVVNGTYDDNGRNLVVIERLESGIVPAATPVLLKCKGLTPKENRLIPLLPDDPRLETAALGVENNLLTGEYGLWTGYTSSPEKYTGRKTYDEATMRVFGVNAAGELGFYKLSAAADGSARELVPNRAYLDMTKLPASAQGVRSFSIIDGDNTNLSGVDILEDRNDASMPEEYYTLEGIRVNTPVRGNLYIVRQGRSAKKIVY